MVLLDRATATT